MVNIIYQDDDIVAINKPHGLLVHKTNIAKDATEFALQMVRDAIKQKVYPVHRLDRKTSGVLVFAKSKKVLKVVNNLFAKGQVKKTYQAIVRGFLPPKGVIDYPLTEGYKMQEAVSAYKVLKEFELNIAFGKFQTSRYSLIEIKPKTGRFHQIRKHMAHIHHPIIGDRPHGCNKQNKLWKEFFEMTTMLLHANHIAFDYPAGNTIQIAAELNTEFKRSLDLLYSKTNSV